MFVMHGWQVAVGDNEVAERIVRERAVQCKRFRARLFCCIGKLLQLAVDDVVVECNW